LSSPRTFPRFLPKTKFAADSALERTGFEPLVPPEPGLSRTSSILRGTEGSNLPPSAGESATNRSSGTLHPQTRRFGPILLVGISAMFWPPKRADAAWEDYAQLIEELDFVSASYPGSRHAGIWRLPPSHDCHYYPHNISARHPLVRDVLAALPLRGLTSEPSAVWASLGALLRSGW
jgi:hypothetical protein